MNVDQVLHLDVASLDSVRTFANAWLKSQRPIHGLINNAGIFSMGGELHYCNIHKTIAVLYDILLL